MPCHHAEAFALGIVVALIIFAIITIFESIIKKWFEKLLRGLGV